MLSGSNHEDLLRFLTLSIFELDVNGFGSLPGCQKTVEEGSGDHPVRVLNRVVEPNHDVSGVLVKAVEV